jgi:eukaryotic-like serine/threonine-protein kinase
MIDLTDQSIGRYHVLEKLGEGGMAVVYKAFDTRLERDVAIKVIRMDAFPPVVLDRVLARFEREAKLLARLDHTNIVAIFDSGEFEGAPYLVMPYLPGGTLKDKTGKPIPYQEACKILIPIAKGLEYAHRHGMVHRDVKPSNILISADGIPRISDFGIGKLLEEEGPQTLTGTGVGVGTPEYMAPEQWLNRVTPQSDIYSLGIVFYELLTGRVPYRADTPAAVLLKQNTDPLPQPKEFVPDLPEAVGRVLFKALAKKPENRYPTMRDFEAALEGLASLKMRDENTYDSLVDNGKEEEPEHLKIQISRKLPALFWPVMAGVALLGLIAIISLAVAANAGSGLAALLATSVPKITPSQTLIVSAALTETQQMGDVISPTQAWTITGAQPTQALAITIAPTETFKIGSSIVSPKDTMVLVYVPAANFRMGSDKSVDSQADDNELPQHTVYLDSYWIDQTEVTNAMYARCVSAGSCTTPGSTSSNSHLNYYGSSQYANYPVVNVNWNQARAYCQWAGRRLPTEAEWEKAARGTDGRIYPWGNQTPDATMANYKNNVGDKSKVGSYPTGASPYGGLDMAGNVWEWVADWYSDTYYRSSPSSNPIGPASGTYRAERGGSWDSLSRYLRASNRYWNDPDNYDGNIGFRCANSLY